MKKLMLIATVVMASFFATPTVYASDWFGGGNNGEWKMGPNGAYWDESDWPEWTPMYWMEEFMDSWDNDNNFGGWGNNRGNNFGGYNNGYGYPNNGYTYGNQYQAPYGYVPPNGGYYYPQTPAVPAVPNQ